MKQFVLTTHNKECSNCPDTTFESQNELENVQILGEEKTPGINIVQVHLNYEDTILCYRVQKKKKRASRRSEDTSIS